MGKKDKKDKKAAAASKGGGAAASKKEGITLQNTTKFAVLDYPGITQPTPTITTSSSTDADNREGHGGKTTGLQGRRATSSSGPRIDNDGKNLIGGNSFTTRSSNPEWLQSREDIFTQVKARRNEELSKKKPVPISVTMPDGNVLSSNKAGELYMAWITTPYDVACTISQGLADSSVVARITYESYVDDYDLGEDGMEVEDVDGMDDAMADIEDPEDSTKTTSDKTFLWDLTRPLVGSVTKMELLKFEDDKDAKTVFWHSSAHMLGEALEHLYGCRLTIGPPLAGGFYYDSFMGNDAFKEEDYKPVETEFNKIIKKKQKFDRLVVTKDEALQLFAGNPFKTTLISTKVPDNARTSVYKCGDLIDLCRGPHLAHTGRVKAFAATRHSATSWLGDTDNDTLQRMYGISFPDKKMLKVWKENQEKAKERDHRRIMQSQSLVMIHDLSPGSAFWLPHGARIYNTLITYIKDQYWIRGYTEVITPNIYNLDLWHKSGHAMHYKDDMFCFDVEGQEWAMKPMNCPGHCLMFGSTIRSYRDLPIRYADFGVLHRNELSGALTGLTRVRRFQQDDAHVFCREDQIEEEVIGALEFMKEVYTTFGMTYKLELSTMPKKALGERALWERAEAALARAMNTFAGEGHWRVNPGDGAFYGPKIDIKVMDAMDRVHQCATVQLDFQLPIRFDLQYNTGTQQKGGGGGGGGGKKSANDGDKKKEAAAAADTKKDDSEQFTRPVIIHRAMLGSVERMFAVLCEHYGGKWPLWLSPRQIMIVPIHADWNEYCQAVRDKLHAERFYVDVDLTRSTFQKKVRNAQVSQYNFQLVVGEAEVKNGTVNIRTRENKVEGEMKVEEMIDMFKKLREEKK